MSPRIPFLRVLLLTLGLLPGACAVAPPQAPSATAQAAAAALPPTPDLLYPELFEAVQSQQVFDDQKHFADAVPRRDPAAIRADYLARRDAPGFDLARFVRDNFEEDPPVQAAAIAQGTDLRTHIDGLWPLLTRSYRDVPRDGTLLPLPEPAVVPGGRFREVYYWDSYFTMLGLAESGRADLSRHMLDNFAYQIDAYGHIPNGNRSYYLTRSQPPFFSYMVEAEAARGGDAVYRRYLPQLKKEHAFWMDGAEAVAPGAAYRRVVRLDDGSVLNRYWDDSDRPRQEAWLHDTRAAAQAGGRAPGEVYRDLRAAAESGWDFSSRWLGDPGQLASIRTTAVVPVDLNSLMYHLETTLALACGKQSGACDEDYAALAQRRKAAVDNYLWNPAGYYADYDWQRRQRSDQLTAAALFPLFAGLAPADGAAQTARAVQAGLVRPGGLATTGVRTGQQWDEPNGWAPLVWVAVDGLRRYGHDDVAATIGRNFLGRVQALFEREHKLVEKYDVDAADAGSAGGGEYPLQDGFGWSNGVTLLLLDLYGTPVGQVHATGQEATAQMR